MIDPYGDDLEDLSVILYVEATLEICDTIMKSKVPDASKKEKPKRNRITKAEIIARLYSGGKDLRAQSGTPKKKWGVGMSTTASKVFGYQSSTKWTLNKATNTEEALVNAKGEKEYVGARCKKCDEPKRYCKECGSKEEITAPKSIL